MKTKRSDRRGAHAPRGRSGGFTFVEMLVVLFVLSLMASIVVTSLDGVTARSTLSRSSRDLGNKLTLLREISMMQARELSMEIDQENGRWREIDAPSIQEVPDRDDREEQTFYGPWFDLPDGVILDEIAFGRGDVERDDVFLVTFSEKGELFPSGFVAYLRHEDIDPNDGNSVEISGLTGVVSYHRGRIEAEEVREEHDF